MKNSIKITSFILSLIMLFTAFLPAAVYAAEQDTLYIRSEGDLVKLAKRCSLDSWSAGKTVILEKDIDLSKSKFKNIPYFSGEFNGNMHTIKGLKVSDSASTSGFFRYIAEGAVVYDLNLEADINPPGKQENIGGLCGKYSGTIRSCSFDGKVDGKNYVGGIAGRNTSAGKIYNCTSKGHVYGEHYTGGIAGDNLGQIIGCKNYAYVNNIPHDVSLDIEKIDFSDIISTENFADVTDTGGIAGYSAGVVQDCKNYGEIGYQHLGYNVGGIVGRQAYYLSGCENHGKVFGRKDIGGICGQTEPFTTIKYSVNSIAAISDEIDALQSIVDRATNNVNSSRLSVSSRLSSVRGDVNNASDAAKAMMDDAQDYYNNTADSINDTIARFSSTANNIMPVVREISNHADTVSTLMREYQKSFDNFLDTVDDIDTKVMKKALTNMRDSVDAFADSAKLLAQGVEIITDNVGDPDDIAYGFERIDNGIRGMKKAMDGISGATDTLKKEIQKIIGTIAGGNRPDREQLLALFKAFAGVITSMKNSSDEFSSAYTEILKGIEVLKRNFDYTNLHNIINGFSRMGKGLRKMSTGFAYLKAFADNMLDAWDDVENSINTLKDTVNEAQATTDKLLGCIDDISGCTDRIIDILDDFIAQPTLTVDRISDSFIDNKNKLSDSLSSLSDAILDVKDILDDAGNTAHGDLTSASDQMFRIFDRITAAVDEMENKGKDPKNYYEDLSDMDVSQQIHGKVSDCVNYGEVNGDLNVGGVAGSMAIEYDFDPEDDAAKDGKKSLNFIYTTKSIVANCKSYGITEARKDNVGAVVGKADLGLITDSIGCGQAKSSTGSYAGGVVGHSSSTVRNSYSKATVGAEAYAGGIAGFGHVIRSCGGLAYITDCDEFAGGIAGDADSDYTDCYFVGGTGGVDGISYEGKAQSVDFGTFANLPNLPKELTYLTLTFRTEDKTVAEVKADYGSSLGKNDIPEVPEEKDRYGKWEKDSFKNITHDEIIYAEYINYVASIEGKTLRSDSLPAFVAEGRFSDSATLTDTRSGQSDTEYWTVSVDGNYADKTTLHYRPDGNANKLKPQIEKDGKWVDLKSSVDGSSLVFDITDKTAKLRFVRKSSAAAIAITLLIVLALITAAALIIFKTGLGKKLRIPRRQTGNA